MSTTPLNPPVPPIAPIPPALSSIVTMERDLTWLHAHILAIVFSVVMLAGTIIGGVSLFESLIERHDARVAAAQQAKEGVDTATTAALMAQLTADRTANAARDAQQAVLIQTLAGQMSQQRTQTAKQIKTDATLSAQDAANRLILQTGAKPSDVTVSNDIVSMTLPLTQNVVADLDLLRQAQSDVNNLGSQLDAQQTLTNDAKVEASDAQNIIAADKVELLATIKADNAACKVEVDNQAKKDRKRGIWVSIISFIGGIAVRGAL